MEIPPENVLNNEQKNELLELRNNFNSMLIKAMNNENIIFHILHDIYPETNNIAELLEQLTDLRKCLNSFRPLNQAQLQNLNQALDIEYTYESNRIEGNTLTLPETDLVINKGITIGGKPMKDHLEAINHNEAVSFIREIARKDVELDEKTLLQIHSIVLSTIDKQNAGFYRSVGVRISGSSHICPNPIKVPYLMDEYFNYYEQNKATMHPVELSANMHEKLVSIHPFIDGNGRTARLVMNLILLKNDYPITIINSDRTKREEYYNSLEASHIEQDNLKFRLLIAKYVKQWLFNYLNMFSGNINEDEKGYYFFKKIQKRLKNT